LGISKIYNKDVELDGSSAVIPVDIQYQNLDDALPIKSVADPEIASAQDTNVATTVEAYARAAGAKQMEVFVESGSIRVRTDGTACTATTGEPLGAGYVGRWLAESISIYFVSNSTITVVSR